MSAIAWRIGKVEQGKEVWELEGFQPEERRGGQWFVVCVKRPIPVSIVSLACEMSLTNTPIGLEVNTQPRMYADCK